MDKKGVQEAIKQADSLLEGVDDPERSLSFPVLLWYLLAEANVVAKSGSPQVVQVSAKRVESVEVEDDFKGLPGGIRLLVKESFFRDGKLSGEILEELKRQRYVYPMTSLPAVLESFQKKRILTRYRGEDDGKWRYVERK